MKKSQKTILLIAAILILAALAAWLGFGGDIWTKTQVIVEKQDELFPDRTYKELVDRFVLGLDYTAAFIGLVIVTAGTLYFVKKKRTEK